MNRRAAGVLPLVLGGLVIAAGAGGQPPPQAGSLVVTKFRTPLRVGGRVVDTGSIFRIYKVGRHDGDWLWLAAGPVAGWVRADEAVPIDRAVDFYTEQIRAKAGSAPDAAHAYVCRGAVHEARDETDAALADYDQAIRLVPDYVAALNNRGTILLDKGRPGDAVADYTQVLRLKPEYVPALFNRGVAWTELGDLRKAVTDFSRAIGLDPSEPQTFYYRGLSLLETGDFDRAASDFTKAIRLDPKRWEAAALLARGTARWRLRDYKNALADCEALIRLDPLDATAHRNLAVLLSTCPDARFRDGRKAVAAARRACALFRKDHPAFLTALAGAYAEAGDFKRAIESQERALTLMVDEGDRKVGEGRLALYRAGKPFHEAADGPSLAPQPTRDETTRGRTRRS